MCPVCRHDIRDPTPVIRSPALTASENTTSVPVAPLNENNEETDYSDDTDVPETPVSRLRTRSDINNMFNRRLE
jgi:hypothetical protein